MSMVLETDRLPTILQEFLRHANNLAKLVQKATWEIVEDIKCMLYDRESKFPLPQIRAQVLTKSSCKVAGE